jgi:tRNA pseudouridine55 synthase
MGRRRSSGRPINGVLLLDKPLGITSNAALQEVKRLFRAAKAGHTGSLDPLANGLLPICFGEATKMSAFLLDADKRYWVRVRLGVKTTTADAEGEVVEERPVPDLTAEQLEPVLQEFRGRISQLPPMYSAVKHQGRRLYELARQGKQVERTPRDITIYSLENRGIDGNYLTLEVHCSKGTYVRTLAEDIGMRLGCGAHVKELRRTQVGPLHDRDCVTLDCLREAAGESLASIDEFILPVE